MALTLASVNASVGVFGSATIVPVVTVNAKGLVTAVSNATIAFPVTSVFGRTGAVSLTSADVTGALGFAPLSNTVLTATGDATGTAASNAIALTLASVGTAGTYNTVTTDAKGRVVSGSNTAYLLANQTIAVTGDATGSGSNAIGLTLATVNANVGVFGNATAHPVVTVNAKGLVTAISNVAITFPVTSVFSRTGAVVLTSNDVTGALGFTPTSNAFTVTGDATGTATGNTVAISLGTVNATVGAFGGATQVATFTVNAKGLITAAANTVITYPVSSVAGRTGAITLAVADVTGAAPLASPALTGTPTAPTAVTSDSSTTLATTAFVKAQSYTGRLLNIQFFKTAGSSTYTPTSGTNFVEVEIVGGGGGGSAAAATGSGQFAAGAGGGGGGIAFKRITSGFSGVTIAVGGGGAAAAGSAGATGGTTSFGAIFSATGGTGGSQGAAQTNTSVGLLGSGPGGTATGGDWNGTGQAGAPGFYGNLPVSGKGGGSPYGDGATYVSSTSSGVAATSSGTGGGGGSTLAGGASVSGGAGAAGLVIVREYS